MVMMEMGNTLEEMDNKKILIVGNGFDLAHNLKTRYSDVLEVFKKRKSFYGLYINRKIDTGFDELIELNYSAKKDSPITAAQRKYLIALTEKHGLESVEDIDALTKSRASKLIDNIISNYGK